MKVFIVVLSAIVATVLANGYGGGYEQSSGAYGGSHSYAVPVVSKVVNVNSGWSNQYRKQDGWTYAFGYDEQHNDAWGSGGSSRHEKSDAWNNKEGSYSLNVGDGRQRVVKYVADGAGFRASIKTNEPGIVASNPASVNINTPHGGYEQQYSNSYSHAAPVVTVVGGYTQEGNSYGSPAASYGGNSGYESSSGY